MEIRLNNTFLVLLVWALYCPTQAQNRKIDSLLNLITKDKEDTNKIMHQNILCREYGNTGIYEEGLAYGKQALALAQSLGFKKGIANAYNNIGVIYFDYGNYPEALKNYFASLTTREEIGDKKGVATSYNNIGNVYKEQTNYSEALKNHFAALKMREEIRDSNGIAMSFINIGNIYHRLGNNDEALKMYSSALKIFEKINDKFAIAVSYNNIGNVYFDKSNYPEAEENYLASLKIREEINDRNGMVSSFINLGELYRKQNNNKEAKEYLDKALGLSKEIGSKDAIKDCYEDLAVLDSIVGDYKEAFTHYKLFTIYRDSLYNKETIKKIAQLEIKYEFEKKEAVEEAHQQKKNIITYSAIIILFLIVMLIAILLNRQNLKAKRDKIIFEQNRILDEKEKELLKIENKRIEDELSNARTMLEDYIRNIIEKNGLLEQFKAEVDHLKILKSKEIEETRIEHLEYLTNATILTEDDWVRFKGLFEQVYKGFFIRLKEKMPDLTQAEIRLFCLTKLKLDTKQMAAILGISAETIKKTRHRLRKKLGLLEEDRLDDVAESV